MGTLNLSGTTAYAYSPGTTSNIGTQLGTTPAGLLDGTANPDFSPAGATVDIVFDLPKAATVTAYQVTASYRYATAYSPKAWTLQGSNDRTTWTDLDTRTGLTAMATGETRTYTLAAAAGPYRYLRWKNTTTGSGDFLWIGDLGVDGAYAATSSPSPLAPWGVVPI